MSTVTLLDEIDDLERLLAGASAPASMSSQPAERLAVADDDEDEDDFYGEDDLGFDDIDEDDPAEDELDPPGDEFEEEMDEEL
jgi:hypothetical protein